MTTDIRYNATTEEFQVISEYVVYERDWNQGHTVPTPCVDILTGGMDTKVLAGLWKASPPSQLPDMICFRDKPDEEVQDTFVRRGGFTLITREDGTYVLEKRKPSVIVAPRPRRRLFM